MCLHSLSGLDYPLRNYLIETNGCPQDTHTQLQKTQNTTKTKKVSIENIINISSSLLSSAPFILPFAEKTK